MNRKKGFTLIELLAVIAILAILAIIVTPIVTNSISKSKRSGFERSVDGLVDAALTDYASNGYSSTVTYTLAGNSFTSSTNKKIKINGSIDGNGKLEIRKSGTYLLAFYNDDYCAIKNEDADKYSITDYNGSCEFQYAPITYKLPSSDCYGLTSGVLNSYSCKDIENLKIPENVNVIGSQSFYDCGIDNRCDNLKNVYISSNVNAVNNNAFGWSYIESVVFDESSDQGLIIEDYAFQENRLTELILPERVTGIGREAFTNNRLEKVIINSSVSIGVAAFESNFISDLTLGENIPMISEYAFADNKLPQVTLPAALTTIGVGAFRGNGITTVTIPANVTTIGNSAFADNHTTKIINKTGRSFNWGKIVGSSDHECVTCTFDTAYGTVTVTDK